MTTDKLHNNYKLENLNIQQSNSIRVQWLLTIFLLMIVQITTAQHKTRADRFFDKGDYINAAKYYET